MATYYLTDSGYLAVTNESPKGFHGVLFIGKIGTDPSDINEGCWEAKQLKTMQSVALADMPEEWVLAFGYDVVEEPIFDLDGDELLDLAPVVVRRPVVVDPTASRWPEYVGAVIGLTTFIIWLIFCN